MHFTCEWPFKAGGLAAGSQNLAQEHGRGDFDCGVMPVVPGCLLSDLCGVCCIRDLVLSSSRDCPCVQPASILS